MRRVLIVDDEPQLTRALDINLTARHYGVATAPDGTTALGLVSRTPPDAIILDLGLPDQPGIDVIQALPGGHGRVHSRPPLRERPAAPPHADRMAAPAPAACGGRREHDHGEPGPEGGAREGQPT
jgi:hypothetical protein